MIKSYFEELAAKENGVFQYKDTTVGLGDGSRSPVVTFLLKFTYKEVDVIIKNETGTAYYGTIIAKINGAKKSMDFEIETISHFKKLFLRNKNQYRIKAKHNGIKTFLANNQAIKELAEISKKTVFEPYIKGESHETTYSLVTKYHLQFDDWTQVLEPFIKFYKDFIDEFENRNTSNYSTLQQ